MEHAYTDPSGIFPPPYVNVKVLDDGMIQVIVRSSPQEDGRSGTAGMIVLQRDVFESVFGPVVDEVRS
jgi:hypothetical protein